MSVEHRYTGPGAKVKGASGGGCIDTTRGLLTPRYQPSTFPLQSRGFPATQNAPGLEGGVDSQFLLALARPRASSPVCSGSVMMGWVGAGNPRER